MKDFILTNNEGVIDTDEIYKMMNENDLLESVDLFQELHSRNQWKMKSQFEEFNENDF